MTLEHTGHKLNLRCLSNEFCIRCRSIIVPIVRCLHLYHRGLISWLHGDEAARIRREALSFRRCIYELNQYGSYMFGVNHAGRALAQIEKQNEP